MIKKYLLASAIMGLAVSANAVELNDNSQDLGLHVKLNGFAHFQAGYRNQKHLAKGEKAASTYKNNIAFFSEAAIVANIANITEDVKYGAKIVLSTTARRKSSNTYNGTHLYIETEYGRVELGSPIAPSAMMMIDAGNITAGSGNWSRYANIAPEYQKQEDLNPTFVTSSEFFLSDKYSTRIDRRSYSSEPSRSIAYYTPKYAITDNTNVTVGVSYTPDSSNTGADNIDTLGTSTETKKIAANNIDRFVFDYSVKDAVSGAVEVTHNFSDGMDLKLALSAEYGKSQGTAKEFAQESDKDPTNEYSLSNLKAYNIGGVLNAGNFSYAASYGSLGKSLTTEAYHRTGRDTKYYTAAINYKQGPFNVSLDYFRSNKFGNTADAWTLGTNFLAAEGLKPYAEITSYKLNGRPEFYSNTAKKKTNGIVVITGIKLSI